MWSSCLNYFLLITGTFLLLAFLLHGTSFDGLGHSPPANVDSAGLLRTWMGKHHIFVSAESENVRYIGHWLMRSNSVYETAFAGSHFDFIVRNTSSIYLSLGNTPTWSDASETGISGDDDLRTWMQALPDHHLGSPVPILVQIDHKPKCTFIKSAAGVVLATANLSPHQTYKVRVQYLPNSPSQGLLQVEGLWLDAAGLLIPHEQKIPESDEMVVGKLSRHGLPSVLKPDLLPQAATAVTRYRRVELVTTARTGVADPMKALNLQETARTIDTSWIDRVARELSIDQSTIAFSDTLLVSPPSNPERKGHTIPQLFFRSGPPSSPLYHIPYHFPSTTTPDVLILDLGLPDYLALVASDLPPTPRTISQFTTHFSSTYTKFILSIRRYAYPLHPDYISTAAALADSTYLYNSAPSTLPIFLLLPFTPNRALQTILHHALRQTISLLRKEGDISTFMLDTTGWLGREDFLAGGGRPNATYPVMTAKAHEKVAALMEIHLCPYLAQKPGEYLFRKREEYRGEIYLPDRAMVDKIMEESKIRKMKAFMGLKVDDGF